MLLGGCEGLCFRLCFFCLLVLVLLKNVARSTQKYYKQHFSLMKARECLYNLPVPSKTLLFTGFLPEQMPKELTEPLGFAYS